MPRPRSVQDEYFRRAKRDGYVARSAYKLIQIDDAKKLLAPGMAVLDLGCAPGAWLQVAGERVGDRGAVVGVDLNPVRHAVPGRVSSLVGDVLEIGPGPPLRELEAITGGERVRFDVVVSDMAPSTDGVTDHERSIELCYAVLALLPGVLKPTGHVAMKVFEGGLYRDLLDETGKLFSACRGFKPKASRDVSREMYVVAKGYLPPASQSRA